MQAAIDETEKAVMRASSSLATAAATAAQHEAEAQIKSAGDAASQSLERAMQGKAPTWLTAGWRDSLCDSASGYYVRGSFDDGLDLVAGAAKDNALLKRAVEVRGLMRGMGGVVAAASRVASLVASNEPVVVPCFVSGGRGCYFAVRPGEFAICRAAGTYHAVRSSLGVAERDVVLSCGSKRLGSAAIWMALLSFGETLDEERLYERTLPFLAAGELRGGADWRRAPPEGAVDDASGAAALLSALKFASGGKEHVVAEVRLAVAQKVLEEASSESLCRAERRALYAGGRGLAAAVDGKVVDDEAFLGQIAEVSQKLVELSKPENERYFSTSTETAIVASSETPPLTSFPLFDCFCEAVDEEKLAGGDRASPLVRPADCAAVGDCATDFADVVVAARACNEACALLSAGGHEHKGERARLLRASLVEHFALRVVPNKLELVVASESQRCELLRSLGQCATQYVAALAAMEPTRERFATRIAVAAKLLYVVDAVTRAKSADDPALEDPFARRYGGRADDFCDAYVAGGTQIVDYLRRAVPALLMTDPASLCAVVAAIEYFVPLASSARPCFSWDKSFFEEGDSTFFGKELAFEYGLEPSFVGEFLTGQKLELFDLAPALRHFRDAHASLRILLVAGGLSLSKKLKASDATPKFQWDPKRGSVGMSVMGLSLSTGLTAAAELEGGSSSFLQKINPLSRGKTPTIVDKWRESLADPSILAGSPVANETDVLHLETLPSFGEALGTRDSELVLQYLTAPYCRIPLLLHFFSAPSRFAALGCSELQIVIDAAIFEPSQLLENGAEQTVETAPAPRPALATRYGLLVNELANAPEGIIAAVDGMLTRIRELDPGRSSSLTTGGHAAAIAYAIRFLGRLEGYVLVVLGKAPFSHALNLEGIELSSREDVEKLREMLDVALRTEIPTMLDRW